MKIFKWLGLFLLTASAAFAQPIQVELVLDQDRFVPDEALKAKVRITNLSGQTLKLGEDNEWLFFNVEGVKNKLVGMRGRVPVEGSFEVPSAARVTTKEGYDIAPYFNLAESGNYSITATVAIKAWGGQIFTSPPRKIDIIKGTILWEKEFGVPPASGVSAPPELRRYTLEQAKHLDKLKLYVRVQDAASLRTVKVFPLAPLLSFSQVEHQIDRFSNLHVMTQTGARVFTYCVVSPEGDLAIRQAHEYTGSRPRLGVDAMGNITVTGGTRRIMATDLPGPLLKLPPEAAGNSAP